jgi:hypothetical protein
MGGSLMISMSLIVERSLGRLERRRAWGYMIPDIRRIGGGVAGRVTVGSSLVEEGAKRGFN